MPKDKVDNKALKSRYSLKARAAGGLSKPLVRAVTYYLEPRLEAKKG